MLSIISCVSTLYINYYKNVDVVFNHFISDFIPLIRKDDMFVKVLEIKDFYVSARCSNTIVSTCAVCGNKSTGCTHCSS